MRDPEKRAREIAAGAPLTKQERLFGVGVTPTQPQQPVPDVSKLVHPTSGQALK